MATHSKDVKPRNERLCVLLCSFLFSQTACRKLPWGIYFTCCFNHVLDVSVWHESFEQEHETRGHESSSTHEEKEEEHRHEGISIGAEWSRSSYSICRDRYVHLMSS